MQVGLGGMDLQAADLMDEVGDRFPRRHEELYAYSAPGQEGVIVNARVAVVGALPVLPAGPGPGAPGGAGPPARPPGLVRGGCRVAASLVQWPGTAAEWTGDARSLCRRPPRP